MKLPPPIRGFCRAAARLLLALGILAAIQAFAEPAAALPASDAQSAPAPEVPAPRAEAATRPARPAANRAALQKNPASKPHLTPSKATSLWHQWSDAEGRVLQAELTARDGDFVVVRTEDKQTYRLNLSKLVPEDRIFAEQAERLLPGPAIPVSEAAAKIDALVGAALSKAGTRRNPPVSEEQFVRRLYLDIAGRIPTAFETFSYCRNPDPEKRGKLIDQLLTSEGHRSHMFNWLCDMLRVTDDYGRGVKSFVYQEWLKEQIAANTHWDTLVYQLLTAEGRISSTGPVGYLLRDRGMPLDNLSNTLTTFLGANVACAQCHDHPSASWTQRNFYEMAAFFGATEQGFNARAANPRKYADLGIDRRLLVPILSTHAARVETLPANRLTFPKDYKYDDAKPGEKVRPALITWQKTDENSPAYGGIKLDDPAQLRDQFASWLTHPDNPRFAMAIANRLWRKTFGLGVQEPVTDLDDPSHASNPALLRHLAEEMKRVHFDLREFQRILFHTATYQAQVSPVPGPEKAGASSGSTEGENAVPRAALFPGPLLRRMTAEQAWDSVLTLAVGPQLDQFKLHRAQMIRELDLAEDEPSPEKVMEQAERLKTLIASGKRPLGGGPKNKGEVSPDAFEGNPPPRFAGLTLARASELPQPAKESHFLRNFGQSDRQLADGNTTEGSIPQILMMMNGEVQEVIANPQSAVLQESKKYPKPEDQVTYMYVSFLGRLPSSAERQSTQALLRGGLTLPDLTWVLFNTREFIFIQ